MCLTFSRYFATVRLCRNIVRPISRAFWFRFAGGNAVNLYRVPCVTIIASRRHLLFLCTRADKATNSVFFCVCVYAHTSVMRVRVRRRLRLSDPHRFQINNIGFVCRVAITSHGENGERICSDLPSLPDRQGFREQSVSRTPGFSKFSISVSQETSSRLTGIQP